MTAIGIKHVDHVWLHGLELEFKGYVTYERANKSRQITSRRDGRGAEGTARLAGQNGLPPKEVAQSGLCYACHHVANVTARRRKC